MPQLIGVPRESAAGEKRVATVPEVVEKLIKLGFRVAVESGAGDAANFPDEAYRAAGAEIVDDAARLWAGADIIFKVRPPSLAEVARMREGTTLVAFIWPACRGDVSGPVGMLTTVGGRGKARAAALRPRTDQHRGGT